MSTPTAEHMLTESRHEVLSHSLRVAGYIVREASTSAARRSQVYTGDGLVCVGTVICGALKPSRLIPFHEQVALGQIGERVLLLLQELERYRAAVAAASAGAGGAP